MSLRGFEDKQQLKRLVIGQVKWLIAVVRHPNKQKLELTEEQQLEALTSLDNVLRIFTAKED